MLSSPLTHMSSKLKNTRHISWANSTMISSFSICYCFIINVYWFRQILNFFFLFSYIFDFFFVFFFRVIFYIWNNNCFIWQWMEKKKKKKKAWDSWNWVERKEISKRILIKAKTTSQDLVKEIYEKHWNWF